MDITLILTYLYKDYEEIIELHESLDVLFYEILSILNLFDSKWNSRKNQKYQLYRQKSK